MSEIAALWTRERFELAERLWAEGYSARAIAEAVGFGCTRSAVLGQVHRRNWLRNGEKPLDAAPPKVVVHVPLMPSTPGKTEGMCAWGSCRFTKQPGRHLCDQHIREQICDRMAAPHRGKFAA